MAARDWLRAKPMWCISLGIHVLLQIVLIYLVASRIHTDNAGFDPKSPDYALYKNTDFQRCMASPSPDSAKINCASAIDIFNRIDGMNVGIVDGTTLVDRTNKTYLWCDAIPCFKDFQIIPSRPRPAAFGQPSLLMWFFWNLTMLGILWASRYAVWGIGDCGGICDGPGFGDYVFFVYDSVSTLYWWIVFFMLAHNPAQYAPVSLFQWWATFRYTITTRRHPISCSSLWESKKRRRVITMVVYLLAICQWIATLFCILLKREDLLKRECDIRWGDKCDLRQKYDCIPGYMISSPGRTNCSTAKICSTERLFADPGFSFDTSFGQTVYIAFFGILSSFTLLFVFSIVLERFASDIREYRASQISGDFWHWFAWPKRTERLLMLVLFIATPMFLTIFLITKDDVTRRQAAFIFDLTCRTVHIPLSPWKQYLDVNAYGRAARVARLWFNV